MRRKIALVDLDDTLVDTIPLMLEEARIHMEIPPFDRLDNDILSRTLSDLEVLQQDPDHPLGVFVDSTPYDWSVSALKKLADAGMSIHLVTSRHRALEPVTHDLLERHQLSRYIDGIHHRQPEQSGVDFKRDTARRLDVSVAFDDRLDTAQALGPMGIRYYLIDKPWNQTDELPANTYRADNFAKAVTTYLSRG